MSLVIDPHMRPILERMRAVPGPDYQAMPIEEARAAFKEASKEWTAGLPEVAEVRDFEITGPAGAMRARLYRPAQGRLPLILFIHGGGWTFGSVDSHEQEMRGLALASGSAVLGFDYRLAPEHPFPAPLEDVRAAVAFARDGGLGADVDAAHIALAGDSAGANLALAALIAERDAGAPPLAGAALFYGCFAPDFGSESHTRCGDGRFGLSSARMRWYWRNFLGAESFDTRSLAAPSRAVLFGLPPLYLAAAGLDPLMDETLALSRALAAEGVKHRLDMVPGVIHGFLRLARELPAARSTLEAAGAYLAMQPKPNPGGDPHATQDVS